MYQDLPKFFIFYLFLLVLLRARVGAGIGAVGLVGVGVAGEGVVGAGVTGEGDGLSVMNI